MEAFGDIVITKVLRYIVTSNEVKDVSSGSADALPVEWKRRNYLSKIKFFPLNF